MKKEKSGFVYIWYDMKHKRYYIGCHWGFENDGYICSSRIMLKAFKRRPYDFKRRIIKRDIQNRDEMFNEELRYLHMIKPEELRHRYYNLNIKGNEVWHSNPDNIKTIGQKISESKKGKNTGKRNPEVGQKISATKKARFDELRLVNENGKAFTQEHIDNMRQAKLDSNHKHTDEWKANHTEMLKRQWADGTRTSNGPLSEEHKQKLSLANKGKTLSSQQVESIRTNMSKQYVITDFNGNQFTVDGLKNYANENNIPYVTLRKCFELDRPCKKYNISNISYS